MWDGPEALARDRKNVEVKQQVAKLDTLPDAIRDCPPVSQRQRPVGIEEARHCAIFERTIRVSAIHDSPAEASSA